MHVLLCSHPQLLPYKHLNLQRPSPKSFLSCKASLFSFVLSPCFLSNSIIKNHGGAAKPADKMSFFSSIPSIDLSEPDSESLLVKACEEVGFFKVTNHAIPLEHMERLEAEAEKFFSLPQLEKEKAAQASPFVYRNISIGPNGDVGWVESLLLPIKAESISQISFSISKDNPDIFCSAANHYIFSVKKLACEVLELLAEGLKIQPRNVFSKLLMDEESDAVFRINHYPPCPEHQALDCNVIGFGEHTDPQIISVLRSNNTTGLQICLRDGSWVSVPPDKTSFYFIVGDVFQVLTNGRFRRVRHRVMASSTKPRVSMIYFGAPALRERIAPLPMLLEGGEKSLYKEFTWYEYKNLLTELYWQMTGLGSLGERESSLMRADMLNSLHGKWEYGKWESW